MAKSTMTREKDRAVWGEPLLDENDPRATAHRSGAGAQLPPPAAAATPRSTQKNAAKNAPAGNPRTAAARAAIAAGTATSGNPRTAAARAAIANGTATPPGNPRTAAARAAAARTAPAATARTGAAPARTARRHAAKGSRRAALAMSVAATGGLSAYFAHLDSATASNVSGQVAVGAAAAPTVAPVAAAAGASAAAPATTVALAATPVAVAAPTGAALADGTFTGATMVNRWGPVQVQITVANGQITDVSALQTPNSRGKSVQINNYAVPYLRQQALQVQSANIDGVSGATYTSIGYAQSLQSAIDAARGA